MKTTTRLAFATAFALGLLAVPNIGHAVQYRSTWNLTNSSGTNSWGTAANWTTDQYNTGTSTWDPSTPAVPNNSTSANPRVAVIGNSTTYDITITGISGTTGRYDISNTGAGSLTLQLGGDLSVQNAQTVTGTGGQLLNSGATADQLIWDLNGHNYTLVVANNTITGARNYTIRNTDFLANSNSSSTWTIPYGSTRTAGTLYIKDNVIFKVTDGTKAMDLRSSTANTAGMIFDRTATLWLAGANGTAIALNAESPNIYGNVIVGSNGAATPTIYNANHPNAHLTMDIRGDLTYYADSYLVNTTPSYITSLKIGGNFTDQASGGAADYGSKIQVYFVSATNGAGGTNLVNITRQGLSSKFFVGDGSMAGNAKLLANLATIGDVRVYGDSTLDAAQKTLTGGTLTIDAGATLKYNFEELSGGGLLSTSGALTLGGVNLVIESDQAWWGGETKLKLFDFGTLSGTPTLASLVLPTGWDGGEWDGAHLDVQGNSIYLVPEPSSMALLLGAGALFALYAARRRRS